ncbi:hypothetical protein FQN54_009341 [Arachnomyces sp. PD_36]|nr:hypothetical protein FQN54_009341 [Arachnomyces sp. PD_36]
MAASDQADTPVKPIPFTGQLPGLVQKAWDEVRSIVSSLPTPTDGTIATFEPSAACKVVIDWIHAEVNPADKSYSKSWGYVYFPGTSLIGRTPTAFVPLDILGTGEIGSEIVRDGFYNQVFQLSTMKVSENGRVAGLVLL